MASNQNKDIYENVIDPGSFEESDEYIEYPTNAEALKKADETDETK